MTELVVRAWETARTVPPCCSPAPTIWTARSASACCGRCRPCSSCAMPTGTFPVLANEIVKDEPRQEAVLDRLLDLLLIAVLRAWFARPGAGWYRAYSARRRPGPAPAPPQPGAPLDGSRAPLCQEAAVLAVDFGLFEERALRSFRPAETTPVHPAPRRRADVVVVGHRLVQRVVEMPARPRAPRQLVLLTGLKGLLGDCVLLGGTAELAQLR
jgi:nucleotide-binding universal stress UspA family protein